MVKCNRGCGATDLRWKVVNSKYKLFNNNDLHISVMMESKHQN